MNGRHAARESTQTNKFPKLEATHGEDPARWLESNELMATGRIRGIRDPELLEAYHAVAKQITAGQFRESVLEAIAERKADLGLSDELDADPTPETPDPVAATDGGEPITNRDNSVKDLHSVDASAESGTTPQSLEKGTLASALSSYPDSASDSIDDEPVETPADSNIAAADVSQPADPEAAISPPSASESVSESPDTLHPDCTGLKCGQVLVLEYPDATEHVWPQTDAADDPFILWAADGDDQPLTQAALFDRIQSADTERRPATEIDEPAPAMAATNGGGT